MKLTTQMLLFIISALFSGAHIDTCSNAHGEEIDHISLLNFKKSISTDPHGTLASWNDSSHFCEWRGVSCRNSKHPRRATILNVSGQGLAGMISPSLGNMTFLTVLNLSYNSFAGEIPPLGYLRRLKILTFESNSLQGRVPADLANCTNLRELYLLMNHLVGEIPTEVASLSKLGILDLSRNNLSGVIPPSLGNISSLSELITTENQLEGRIPNELGQLSRLTVLAIGSNKLSGGIPQSIFNLSSLKAMSLERNQLRMPYLPSDLGTTLHNLQLIYLDYNQFAGPIPPSLSNASHLAEIDLSFNSFTGHVPETLGSLGKLMWLSLEFNYLVADDKRSWMFMDALTNCSSLNVLALYQNQLSGQLPSSVGNLSSQLQYLLLGHNKISGSVPSSIGNLQGITNLGLDSNNFYGSITKWVGNFKIMEKLFLSGNSFVGPIPSSLGNLSRLFSLNLEANKFDGSIPAAIGQLQHLQLLDISHNQLNGSIPVDLFNLPAAITLDLSHNILNGILPREIGNAKQLSGIDISSNKISGEIPETLGDCESFETIIMGNNFLAGKIPVSLANLKNLQLLDLSHNNLSETVPGFLGSLKMLHTLDLSYNYLQGEVPKNGIFTNATALILTGNQNLCGGITELHLSPCPVEPSRERRLPHSRKIVILVACPMLILALIIIVLFLCRKKLEQNSLMMPSVLDMHLPQVSYMDLAKSTNNFSPSNLIGKGAHGSVYRGFISHLKTDVAVKVFNLEMHRAQRSFLAECQTLKGIKHRNLVGVLTACSSIDPRGDEFKAIVYEFMPNGNLDEHIHSQQSNEHGVGHIILAQRLNIAIDMANALDYLHHSTKPLVVHCDLKPSNILLDDDMGAHIGDFGLAKLRNDCASVSAGCSTSSVGFRGTIGYAAPEYATGGHISTAVDVYSFGVLLLEMLTGKRPTDAIFMDDLSLISFVQTNFPDKITTIIDEYLQEDGDTLNKEAQSACDGRVHECIQSMLEIGLACTQQLPKERPNMQEVARKLLATKVAYHKSSEC
uniref:Receptor kinase-like protein Xa21 n=1 Tax=Oryza brachyantha TaxID=4533 RepID=J3NDN8_ORYBR